jgi:hypothetical protein
MKSKVGFAKGNPFRKQQARALQYKNWMERMEMKS